MAAQRRRRRKGEAPHDPMDPYTRESEWGKYQCLRCRCPGYQVDEKALFRSTHRTVEDCVAAVGARLERVIRVLERAGLTTHTTRTRRDVD